jgi:hypothetical protein
MFGGHEVAGGGPRIFFVIVIKATSFPSSSLIITDDAFTSPYFVCYQHIDEITFTVALGSEFVTDHSWSLSVDRL